MTPDHHRRLVSVAALFKRRLSSLHAFSRLHLLAMIEWHAARSSLAVASDPVTGAVVAAGAARPLRRAEDHRHRYAWHDDGRLVWVDVAVASRPDALRSLLVAMYSRFPNCECVGFTRQKSGHRIKTYPIRNFLLHAGLPS